MITKNDNPRIQALTAMLVASEVSKHSAVDAETLTRAILHDVQVDEDGSIRMTDLTGQTRMRDGRPETLAEHLDGLKSAKPALFHGSAAKAGAAEDPFPNPFAKGPTFSLTNQMTLWRSDPEKAEKLATEAGMKITTRR